MTTDANIFVHHRATEHTELVRSAGRVVSLQQLRQQQELQTAPPSKRLDGRGAKRLERPFSFAYFLNSLCTIVVHGFAAPIGLTPEAHSNSTNADDVSESNHDDAPNDNQESIRANLCVVGRSTPRHDSVETLFAVLCDLCGSVVNKREACHG